MHHDFACWCPFYFFFVPASQTPCSSWHILWASVNTSIAQVWRTKMSMKVQQPVRLYLDRHKTCASETWLIDFFHWGYHSYLRLDQRQMLSQVNFIYIALDHKFASGDFTTGGHIWQKRLMYNLGFQQGKSKKPSEGVIEEDSLS